MSDKIKISSRSASDCTHALKEFGNGDMFRGISKLGKDNYKAPFFVSIGFIAFSLVLGVINDLDL